MNDLHMRYEAAERLLPHQWTNLIFSGAIKPNWIAGSDKFWYANRNRHGTSFVLVDPDARTRTALFDHEQLARCLSTALGRPIDANQLPVRSVEIRSADETLLLHVDEKVWRYHAQGAALTPTLEPAMNPFVESIAPDGSKAVFVRDHNIFLRDRFGGIERQLTYDGIEAHSFGTQPDVSAFRFSLGALGLQFPPAVAWSPDSRRFVTHRIDERALPFMHYVESVPREGGRPRLHSQRYAMVDEDAVSIAELIVFDVETGRATNVHEGEIQVPYRSPVTAGHVWWGRDGERIYFISGTRGDRAIRLYGVDLTTGSTELLVEEASDTQAQIHPLWLRGVNAHVLDSGETIWWSERSGWGHLYLYADDGSVRPLTAGQWLVRDLICVDEDARVAVFSAAGREDRLDPYMRQLYRVDLESGVVERVSDDVLDHSATASPSNRYLIDTTSWLDVPERSYLRGLTEDVVLELEQADAAPLYETGWTAPERFTVKAADGATDLYGLLYKPHRFDPAARYPVLDDIYPGPQICAAGVRFCERTITAHAASMAALGFAVVVIDGRGTPLRSKAFQEACRGRHSLENIDDHVVAIQQIAATRSWLDLDRVGIYGMSGGGRASTLALLRHPEFFKVAVSACGDHDDLLYHAVWGEKYVGSGDREDYLVRANPTYASRLRGKLLLIHGELDDNVTPYLTLRLVDAFMTQDKDCDLMIVPQADHLLLAHQAHWLRRRWDYFARHLLDQEPPTYRVADVPVDFDALITAIGAR